MASSSRLFCSALNASLRAANLNRHLVGELVDEGLLEGDLAILAGRLGDEGAHHLAQLLRVKVLDLCFVDHET